MMPLSFMESGFSGGFPLLCSVSRVFRSSLAFCIVSMATSRGQRSQTCGGLETGSHCRIPGKEDLKRGPGNRLQPDT